MTFLNLSCIKTCQREQVNKNLQHFFTQNAVWTIFKQLCFVIFREGWETRKESLNLFLMIFEYFIKKQLDDEHFLSKMFNHFLNDQKASKYANRPKTFLRNFF